MCSRYKKPSTPRSTQMEGGGGQEIVENNEASDQVNRPRNFKEVSGTARKNFKKSQNYCV